MELLDEQALSTNLINKPSRRQSASGLVPVKRVYEVDSGQLQGKLSLRALVPKRDPRFSYN